MPTSLAADDLQVRCGGLSSGACGVWSKLCWGCPLPGFRKKTCREAGSSSAHWKNSSRIGQSVSGRESSGCWVASWDAGISSSRRGLAAGMLTRWQAAPIWPLLAKGGITDASATLRNISFLRSWLCCCVSDQLRKIPTWPTDLPS